MGRASFVTTFQQQISVKYFIINVLGSSLSKPHAAVTFVRITNKQGHYNPAIQPTHKRELKYFFSTHQTLFQLRVLVKTKAQQSVSSNLPIGQAFRLSSYCWSIVSQL